MNENGNGKRTNMDFTRLESTIEQLHEVYGSDGSTPNSIANHTLENAIYYLEYLEESITNRKLYHKKQNAKKAIATRIIKSLLSQDELAEIDRQADVAIGNTVQEPTFE